MRTRLMRGEAAAEAEAFTAVAAFTAAAFTAAVGMAAGAGAGEAGAGVGALTGLDITTLIIPGITTLTGITGILTDPITPIDGCCG